MSSAAPETRPFDRDASRRRVRHPLQTLRKYIRTYVVLEGLAVAALFVAAWFWIGLALDWGTFKLFALDWVQELRDVSGETNNALWARAILLGALVFALVALVVTRIALRWLREFSDPTLALVLERRFPRELGDRLITAVELSDPKMAGEYGYSPALVEQTIRDVEGRLERLPVAEAFNWRRLAGLWLLVGAVTLGLYLLVGVTSVAVGAIAGDGESPVEFVFDFHVSASIWAERNLLLMNSLWPRRAHLEITRFQHAQDSPNEMRVGRDEQRPDIQVRALQWVVADRDTPDGWRALRWADLDRFIEKDLLDRVDIPADWPGWVIDLDDLDPRVPAGVVPANLNLKRAGEIRQALAQPTLATQVEKAGAQDAVDELLDWHRWMVDKLIVQDEKQEVRLPLRQTAGYEPLMEVVARLEEIAKSPRWSRTVRKLVVPQYVEVHYRGANTKATEPCQALPDRKFSIGLANLKESVRFRVRGEDYYTPAKLITLVPPPSITKLTVDKEEPAYLHHRLQGGEQAPLKGKKQVYRDYAVSITGELSTIEVPLGTDLVIRAETDRKLKEPVRLTSAANREAGFAAATGNPTLNPDGKGFELRLAHVERPVEFFFEYNDEDNVKGRRRVRVRPLDDQPPEVVNVDLSVVLRKPRFKGDAGKAAPGGATDAFLITPDALLPFQGTVRDDHGLNRVGWTSEADPIDLELIGGVGGKDRVPVLVLSGNAGNRRAGLVVSTLQFGPAGPAPLQLLPQYTLWAARVLEADLKRTAGHTQGEKFRMMEGFKALLERRSIEEIPQTALGAKLHEPPPRRERWEYQLKEEAGFDVKRYLPKLKAANPREEGQLHYLLKLGVLATDNNVESGTAYPGDDGRTFWGNSSRTKTPFSFLVVSENELLAQIALEEESLYERLDKLVDRLKNGKTLAEEQVAKLNGTLRDDELGLVALRLDEVRKIVLDGASGTREIAADYGRILKEMDVNRVAPSKSDKVANKIVAPLEQVVDPKAGNFVLSEDFLLRAYQLVDEDVAAGKGLKNKAKHVQAIRDARDQLNILIDRLNSVLIAMNEGIVESRLLETLITIERTQRQSSETLRAIRAKEEADLIDLLKGLK
jgi:hypothetical protein